MHFKPLPLIIHQTMAFSAVFSPSLNLAMSSTMYCYSRRRTSNTATVTVRASSSTDSKGESKDKDSPTFNPFGFVTDNPSSRSAIQLPENPAEDGNVGQMLYVIIVSILLVFTSFYIYFPSSFFTPLGLGLLRGSVVYAW